MSNKKDKIVIPVVLSADDNYAMPLAVTLTSILMNANQTTFYDVYILTPTLFNQDNKDKILSLEEYNNCEINFIDMKNNFTNSPNRLSHTTNPAYYRLLISDILPNYEKAIYLDADIIVRTDLQNLYDNELLDSYIGAVLHPVYYFDNSKSYSELLGIKDLKNYINSGVLLLNLKLIREDKITAKFVNGVLKNYPTVDQDVINSICYGKIKFLPFKYNVMPKCNIFLNDSRIAEIYDKNEYLEAFENPAIIHWANPQKPWNQDDLMFDKEWINYFEKSPFADIELVNRIEFVNSNNNIEKWKKDYKIAQDELKQSISYGNELQKKNKKLRFQRKVLLIAIIFIIAILLFVLLK